LFSKVYERKATQANEKDFDSGIKYRHKGISDKIEQIFTGEI